VQHGTAAKTHIERSIDFYASVFQDTSKLDWPQVQDIAGSFSEHIKKTWPEYHEEMQGMRNRSDSDTKERCSTDLTREQAWQQALTVRSSTSSR
jgi:isopenicillin-N N-acyltransferase-like protein